ncbi:MAG TPA: alpha/beta hydrolase [Vicinamibacterales bacterium]|nr:alpha/beta hydrolase [Vicinamibacterales bacterium]
MCRRRLGVVFGLALAASGVAGVTAQRPASASASGPVDRFVMVNGLRLHYVDWGNTGAPPFVMVHGLDRVARTFDHVAPHFTARYHVLALDMRGHGDSGWDPAARYRVEDHAGDLAGFVAALRLRDLVVWGNSTGGRVVQVFAGMHPDLVSHVIAEDVGPERPRQIADNYSRRVAQEEAGWASEDELLAQLRKSNPGTPDDVLLPYVRYGTRKRDDGRIVWKRDPKLVNGFVATDLWRFVREIKAPTLYVIGGRSTIVPQDTQDELKKVLPRVTIVTIPGVGHYPSDEKPAEFLEIVDRFLGGGAP